MSKDTPWTASCWPYQTPTLFRLSATWSVLVFLGEAAAAAATVALTSTPPPAIRPVERLVSAPVSVVVVVSLVIVSSS